MIGLATPLRIITPIPSLKRAIQPVFGHHLGQYRPIRRRPRLGRTPNLHQQIADPSRRLGHLCFQFEV